MEYLNRVLKIVEDSLDFGEIHCLTGRKVCRQPVGVLQLLEARLDLPTVLRTNRALTTSCTVAK